MTKTIPAVRYTDNDGKSVVVTFKFGGRKSAVLFLNRCILDYGLKCNTSVRRSVIGLRERRRAGLEPAICPSNSGDTNG